MLHLAQIEHVEIMVTMKTIQLANLSVLLWNEQTHEWRIESIDHVLQENMRYFLGERDESPSGWLVLALADTVRECALIQKKLTEALDRPLE
jgi:hypothetical protein